MNLLILTSFIIHQVAWVRNLKGYLRLSALHTQMVFTSHWPDIWNSASHFWHSHHGSLSCTSSLTLTSTASCLISLLWQLIHCPHCSHSDFQKDESHCFSSMRILSLVPLWPLEHNPAPRFTSEALPGAPVWPHLLTHFILYVTGFN